MADEERMIEEEEEPQGPKRIERVPWSELGPEFAKIWGRADPRNPQPEHMEIVGMSGSGKTHLMAKAIQDRCMLRNTPAVIICTKPADATVLKMGWPITDDVRQVRKKRQAIFWPKTRRIGPERRAYHHAKIQDLLERFWTPDSNTIVAFDEIAYVESLGADTRDTIEMYWREGRSQGITLIGMKQRPQGANRHMSSETQWTAAFKPKDQADAERFAELFGPRKVWLPVFDQMKYGNHEFLIRHQNTGDAYISYVDEPLRPRRPKGNPGIFG